MGSWFSEEEVWPESKGMGTGMSQASLGTEMRLACANTGRSAP